MNLTIDTIELGDCVQLAIVAAILITIAIGLDLCNRRLRRLAENIRAVDKKKIPIYKGKLYAVASGDYGKFLIDRWVFYTHDGYRYKLHSDERPWFVEGYKITPIGLLDPTFEEIGNSNEFLFRFFFYVEDIGDELEENI